MSVALRLSTCGRSIARKGGEIEPQDSKQYKNRRAHGMPGATGTCSGWSFYIDISLRQQGCRWWNDALNTLVATLHRAMLEIILT
jgi:hypothetical protein